MPTPVNENFEASVSVTDFSHEPVRSLELTANRLTVLSHLPASSTFRIRDSLQDTTIMFKPKPDQWRGIEILILEGSCSLYDKTHTQGHYLRIPSHADASLSAITDCVLFVKYNQFLTDDAGARTIDTRVPDKWLPGPVDGIEIRPLHVFDTESIMLLRWQHAAEFRPKLNPRGEEILVINGLLQNRDNLYKQYSWIRNPIEDWRKWHGNTGTLIYYKSGHFPDDPNRRGQ